MKRMEEIEEGNTFTFNCTPSAADPPPSSYVFERDGVARDTQKIEVLRGLQNM